MNLGIKKFNRIISYICIGIMMIMLLSILLRVFTRQVCVEKLGMDNAFTRLVFFDTARLQEEVTHTDAEKTNWEELYPFKEEATDEEGVIREIEEVVAEGAREESRYIKIINSVKTKIEDYSTDFLMGHDLAANVAASFDKILQWETPVSPKDFNRIITMENGYLTYVQPRIESRDIDVMVESVRGFDEYLKTMDIPLLVVNNGSKINPEDMQLSEFEKQFEHTNENGDELMGKLNDLGINTLDMRYEMLNDGLDWYSCYYKTDHHWTPLAGLYAAGKIAGKLNEISEADFDLSLFDKSNYEITTYEKIMFGGEGRRVTMAKADLEDYTGVLPNFETDLTVEFAEERTYTGSYEVSVYGIEKLEKVKKYSGTDFLSLNDAYGTIRLFNTPLTEITNNMPTCNKELKILYIQDSFSWYSTSFLSLGTGKTDIIYSPAFTGSIRSYVEETRPDIVVFSFCEKAIDPIDYSTHSTYFDLR